MDTSLQLSLFKNTETKKSVDFRSGTFLDNMKLPIHRWFRFSAGYSAQWVIEVLKNFNPKNGEIILDPFAGSATTLLASDTLGLDSIGIEAHPFISRIAKIKINWDIDSSLFLEKSNEVLSLARREYPIKNNIDSYPILIKRFFLSVSFPLSI